MFQDPLFSTSNEVVDLQIPAIPQTPALENTAVSVAAQRRNAVLLQTSLDDRVSMNSASNGVFDLFIDEQSDSVGGLRSLSRKRSYAATVAPSGAIDRFVFFVRKDSVGYAPVTSVAQLRRVGRAAKKRALLELVPSAEVDNAEQGRRNERFVNLGFELEGEDELDTVNSGITAS